MTPTEAAVSSTTQVTLLTSFRPPGTGRPWAAISPAAVKRNVAKKMEPAISAQRRRYRSMSKKEKTWTPTLMQY